MAPSSNTSQSVAPVARGNAIRRWKLRWLLRLFVGLVLIGYWANEIVPLMPEDAQDARLFLYAMVGTAGVFVWLAERAIIGFLITPLERWRKNRVTIRRIRIPVAPPPEASAFADARGEPGNLRDDDR